MVMENRASHCGCFECVDRINGYVVDFIDFYIGSWHWYVFNVADAAICVGVSNLTCFISDEYGLFDGKCGFIALLSHFMTVVPCP